MARKVQDRYGFPFIFLQVHTPDKSGVKGGEIGWTSYGFNYWECYKRDNEESNVSRPAFFSPAHWRITAHSHMGNSTDTKWTIHTSCQTCPTHWQNSYFSSEPDSPRLLSRYRHQSCRSVRWQHSWAFAWNGSCLVAYHRLPSRSPKLHLEKRTRTPARVFVKINPWNHFPELGFFSSRARTCPKNCRQITTIMAGGWWFGYRKIKHFTFIQSQDKELLRPPPEHIRWHDQCNNPGDVK